MGPSGPRRSESAPETAHPLEPLDRPATILPSLASLPEDLRGRGGSSDDLGPSALGAGARPEPDGRTRTAELASVWQPRPWDRGRGTVGGAGTGRLGSRVSGGRDRE